MSCDALLRVSEDAKPFSSGVIVDWYDGAVSGAARCANGEEAFAFRLVAWDDQQRRRIFVLRRLHPDQLSQLESYVPMSSRTTADWSTLQGFASDAERDEAWRAANELLDRSSDVKYVVLATDIATNVMAATAVEREAERQRVERMLLKQPSEEDGYVFSEDSFETWLALFSRDDLTTAN